MPSPEGDVFSRSLGAALLFGFVGGAMLLVVGLLGVTNWHGVAARYTRWTQAWVPGFGGSEPDQRLAKDLIRQRVIFGVIAAFGVLLLVGGLISVVRR